MVESNLVSGRTINFCNRVASKSASDIENNNMMAEKILTCERRANMFWS